MNRFSRILAAIAAMATMSCNANDSRTTVRYSILEDPETTPAEIKSWEAYAFVFSGGKCTYSGYWKELSDLVAIDADKDDIVTVVAVESMTNLGLPLLEPARRENTVSSRTIFHRRLPGYGHPQAGFPEMTTPFFSS